MLCIAAVAYAVLSSAVIPALPTFQRSLRASETGATWLLTGFLLSASVGAAIQTGRRSPGWRRPVAAWPR